MMSFWRFCQSVMFFIELVMVFQNSVVLSQQLQRGRKDSTRCPSNEWKYYEEMCFYHDSEAISYSQAGVLCNGKAKGAHVVKLRSREDFEFIKTEFTIGERFWIGLRRRGGSWHNQLIWEDGTEVTYINWHPGEPSDAARENCIQIITRTGGYFDCPCNWILPVACSIPAEKRKKTTKIKNSSIIVGPVAGVAAVLVILGGLLGYKVFCRKKQNQNSDYSAYAAQNSAYGTSYGASYGGSSYGGQYG